MDDIWAAYNAYLGTNGRTMRERIINQAKDDFLLDIKDSPSYHEVDIDGEIRKLKIDSTAARDKKNIRTMPGERINLGNIVTWNDMHWLVIDIDFDDTLSLVGTMQHCNRMIYWQNQKTYEIIARWCVVVKPYYSNLNEDETVTTPTGEYKVTIPYDEETKLIGIDKRLLIGEVDGLPQAFKVIHRDEITGRYEDLIDSGSGFLIWNIRQDQFDYDKDNAELMIANYIDIDMLGSDNKEQTEIEKRCVISGNNIIKAGIGERIYKAEFTNTDKNSFSKIKEDDSEADEDNREETVLSPVWQIKCDNEEMLDYIHYEVIDDELHVTVDDHKGILGTTFDILLSCEDEDYLPDQFTVEVKGIYE